MRIGQIAIDIAPLRGNRDFQRLFAGRFMAMAGAAIATTAADWQVYALTHDSLAVGLLTLAASAGMFTGLLTGGMLADRHDRRRLLTVVRFPQAALALLLMLNSLLPRPACWPGCPRRRPPLPPRHWWARKSFPPRPRSTRRPASSACWAARLWPAC
jgi:MFS transporter, ENTS family, enterobactin (siderophore) exporter